MQNYDCIGNYKAAVLMTRNMIFIAKFSFLIVKQ